jgi:hypothetical protein
MKKCEKEIEVPVVCICGCRPVIVMDRQRKRIVSCPDPERCVGNFYTSKHRNEDAAVREWNSLIGCYRG